MKQVRHTLRIALLSALAVIVGAGGLSLTTASAAGTGSGTSSSSQSPASGWTLHIDAKLHFPGNPNAIAHHWCRPAAGGITECLLFASDTPNAAVVGEEIVVPTATWKTFSPTEQALWHYHRVEIPKVSATLPGMTKAQADKVVAGMLETYGKVYLLWDPTKQQQPTGQPFVNVLK
jgi:hypothetical protein